MDKLDRYREAALRLALARIDVRLPNSSLEHAQILIEIMILNTRSDEDLYIYSGNLRQDVYEPWLLTTRARDIQILLDDDSNLSWLDPIKERRGNTISVNRITKPRKNHFLCTTGNFFRFETDPESFSAEANFNEPDVVKKLIAAHKRYSTAA